MSRPTIVLDFDSITGGNNRNADIQMIIIIKA